MVPLFAYWAHSHIVCGQNQNMRHIIFLHNGGWKVAAHTKSGSAFFNIKSWPIQRKEYIFHCGLGIRASVRQRWTEPPDFPGILPSEPILWRTQSAHIALFGKWAKEMCGGYAWIPVDVIERSSVYFALCLETFCQSRKSANAAQISRVRGMIKLLSDKNVAAAVLSSCDVRRDFSLLHPLSLCAEKLPRGWYTQMILYQKRFDMYLKGKYHNVTETLFICCLSLTLCGSWGYA